MDDDPESLESDSPCTNCKSITLDGCGFLGTKLRHSVQARFIKPRHFGHTVAKVETNSAHCRLCSIVQDIVKSAALNNHPAAQQPESLLHFKAITKEHPHIAVSTTRGDHDDLESYLIALSVKIGYDELAILRVYTQGDNERLASLIPGRPLRHPESVECDHLVKRWMQNCMQNHAKCRIGLSGTMYTDNGDNPLPARLIHVGDALTGPRLVNTINQCGRYVALSYCWEDTSESSANLCQLKQDNLDILTDALPVDQCPKTIRDALQITRMLGFDYIWIDRLCIQQDSKADWDAQASLMGEIYEGATITIAALGAYSATDGCYLERTIPPCATIPCTLNGQQLGVMSLARPFHNMGSRSHFDSELQNVRWNARGWTFPERLLSRRIIHYGSQQLYWECQEAMLQECEEVEQPNYYGLLQDSGTNLKAKTANGLLRSENQLEAIVEQLAPVPGFRYAATAPGSLLGRTLRQATKLISPPDFDHALQWNALVVEYARRSLTYPSDRVTAIDGLARMIAQRTKQRYAAGLWLNDLQRGFFWAPKHLLEEPDREGSISAPSWSWLSFAGAVTSHTNIISGGNVKKMTSGSKQSQDHYLGSLKLMEDPNAGPSLKFEAFMFPARRATHSNGLWPDQLREAANRKFDAGILSVLAAPFPIELTYSLFVEETHIGRVHFDYVKKPPESFYCIVLLSSPAEASTRRKTNGCWRLLIVEVTDPQTMQCKRLGIGNAIFWKSINFGMPLDAILQRRTIQLW